jgi:membrane-anchored protein YejM (alkaline phosphatase superfamily)
MPQLWNFSEHALRLEQHYSGGNTTQMGIFSMFYGLVRQLLVSDASTRAGPPC